MNKNTRDESWVPNLRGAFHGHTVLMGSPLLPLPSIILPSLGDDDDDDFHFREHFPV